MTRRTRLLEDVMTLPWPVGVALAAVVFVGSQLYFSRPTDNAIVGAMYPGFLLLGKVLSGLFLFAAFVSFITQVIRRKRFKTTNSIADIRSLTWRQFESYIGELFRTEGYFVLETPEGPDNGVDLVLRKGGEKTYVQCKHWKTNQVGVDKVRELLGSMTAGGAHSGIFVTSGTYTQPARDLARECGIRLIGGDELAGLLKQNTIDGTSVATPTAQIIEMSCPVCQSPMVKRTAKQGPNKGNEFWGCPKYPQCRGTRPI
jgi:restriction system protein